MADLTVSIRVTLPGIIDDSREETVTVPPDYAERDILYFVAHAVENIGPRLLREDGFPTPNQEAFFANVARLARVEELIDIFNRNNSAPTPLLDALRELHVVDAPEAIRRWGTPVVEPTDPRVVS